MSEQLDRTWKLILGQKLREIRGVKGLDSRKETVYHIVTSDGSQLILSGYTKLPTVDGLDDKAKKSLIEINGEYYQSMNSQSYHPNLHYAIKQYLTENHILSPKKDIIKIEDAVQLYLDAEKEFKRLCDLGGKK